MRARAAECGGGWRSSVSPAAAPASADDPRRSRPIRRRESVRVARTGLWWVAFFFLMAAAAGKPGAIHRSAACASLIFIWRCSRGSWSRISALAGSRRPGDETRSPSFLVGRPSASSARSLKAYLESFPDLRVVAPPRAARNCSSTSTRAAGRDCSGSPAARGIDGIETTRRVLAKRPSVRVVALTASPTRRG